MLIAGSRLGPYEILAPLGAGGMGEVYRARDTRLGRDVAVKVLPATVAAEEARLRRFEQEARATAALNHPNILAIFDIGTHDSAPYVVSELLEGETLRKRLSLGPLPTRNAVAFGVQIAQGLAAAHEKGIVHRDLKPENLFVSSDGHVKILDFGLAKLMQSNEALLRDEAAKTPALTRTGVLVGTVAYMSPEQARGFPVDHRSDIFSFGLVLYEMLAGRPPFCKETPVDTISALLHSDPPELAGLAPPLGTALDRIVRHCLEKRPEDRFSSARDVAFALSSLGSEPTRLSGLLAFRGLWRRRWWRPAVALGLACAGLAIAFLSGTRLGPGRGLAQPTFSQRSFKAQTVLTARFAPDGQTIVYSAAQRGYLPDLYWIRPEYPEGVPVAGRGSHLLSVSPGGELAVLTRVRPRVFRVLVGTLARVPLGGGAPREIIDEVHDAAWLPDGQELAILREVGGKDRLEAPIGKVLLESAGYLSDLRVSPNGDHIAFLEHPIRFDNQGFATIVDRTGRRVTQSEASDAVEGLAWGPDGSELFYSAQAGAGLNNLAVRALSVSGRQRLALSSIGRVTIHDVAPDGRWLVTRDDWRIEIVVKAPGEASERDVSWLDSGIQPLLSGDGRTLLFLDQSQAAGPTSAVYMRKTDGSPVVRLGEGVSRDLSPDGRFVLSMLPTAPPQLRVFPTGAGDLKAIDLPTLESVTSAKWCGAGGDVIVCGNEAGHATRCYLRGRSDNELRAVTPEGVGEAFPSPDGTRVAATVAGRGAFVFPVAGGEPVALPAVTPEDAIGRFSPDGRALWIWRLPAQVILVDSLDLATGRRAPLVQIPMRTSVGVSGVRLSLADDPACYAYQTWQTLSHLFIVSGVR